MCSPVSAPTITCGNRGARDWLFGTESEDRLTGTMAEMAGRIVRVWKGYGSAEGVQRYCDEHFSRTVLPRLRAIGGFHSANVLVRRPEQESHETEVVVATVWDSMEAITAFTGQNFEEAVVEPVVRDLLDRFDDRVTHYTVALTS